MDGFDEIALMDAAVGRLSASYRDAGLQPIAAPTDVEQVLHDIAEAIAPLRMTAELEQFWRTVDPHSVRVAPYPTLCSPAFAPQYWRQDREILRIATESGMPHQGRSHVVLAARDRCSRGDKTWWSSGTVEPLGKSGEIMFSA